MNASTVQRTLQDNVHSASEAQASLAQPIIDALTDDGSEWWADDKSVGYRLTIAADEDCSINDYECYGRIEWTRPDSCTGRHERPAGFTGAARKFGVGRSYDICWWEPYREGHKVYDDELSRRIVRDLLEEGFKYVAVEKLSYCDHNGVHVDEGAGLGGIDSLDNGYLAEVVGDLLAELEVTP